MDRLRRGAASGERCGVGGERRGAAEAAAMRGGAGLGEARQRRRWLAAAAPMRLEAAARRDEREGAAA